MEAVCSLYTLNYPYCISFYWRDAEGDVCFATQNSYEPAEGFGV